MERWYPQWTILGGSHVHNYPGSYQPWMRRHKYERRTFKVKGQRRSNWRERPASMRNSARSVW